MFVDSRQPGESPAKIGRPTGALAVALVSVTVLAGCGQLGEESSPSLLTRGVNECHAWAQTRLSEGEQIEFPTGDDDRVSLGTGQMGAPDRTIPTVELGTPYVVSDSDDSVVEEGEMMCVVAERGGGLERLALNFRG